MDKASNIKEQLFTAIREQNVQSVQELLFAYLESITSSHDKFIAAAFNLVKYCYCGKAEITELVIGEVLKRDNNNILGLHLLESAIKWEDVEAVAQLLNHQGVDLKSGENRDFLHQAIFMDNLEIAELLLKREIDINTTVRGNNTPLHVAAGYNRVQGMELLLNYGADHKIRTSDDFTPLDTASCAGSTECIKILVDRGSDVNAVGPIKGETPLEIAVTNDKLNSVECLSSCDAVTEATKTKALHEALVKGREDMAKVLIGSGADILTRTLKDESSLHLAAKGNCVEIIQFLLTRGFNVNAKTLDNNQPLYYAVLHGHLESAICLLDRGAKVTDGEPSDDCEPLVHAAVKQGNVKILELVIEQGVDVNRVYKGYSALYVALKGGHSDHAILLVNRGADVNVHSSKGKSPLFKAVKVSTLQVIKHLVKNEADVNYRNGENKETSLHIASEKGFLKTATLLIDQGADVNARCKSDTTPISRAITSNQMEMVELLLDKRVDIKGTTCGKTLLHLAVSKGHLNIANQLLTFGADMTASRDERGYTTLHFAVESGCLETVKLILDHQGADVNCATQIGLTPLHLAASKGFYQILKCLINHGAKVHLFTYFGEGMRALDFASENGCLKTVKYLLMNGASSAKDFPLKRSSLFRAAARGHIKVFLTLLDNGADMKNNYYDIFHLSSGYIKNKSINCFDDNDEFDYSSVDYSKFNELLVKLLVIMQSKKIEFDPNYSIIISSCSILSKLQFNCKREVERMKSTFIQSVSLSLYDFFAKMSFDELACLVRNKMILQAFNATNLSEKFPLYANLIKRQFEESLERRDFLDEGKKKLRILFPKLLEFCFDIVLRNLSNMDIHNLISAFNSND